MTGTEQLPHHPGNPSGAARDLVELRTHLNALIAFWEARCRIAVETLDKLQRLGNEPNIGNSTGNTMARHCLRDIGELPEEL